MHVIDSDHVELPVTTKFKNRQRSLLSKSMHAPLSEVYKKIISKNSSEFDLFLDMPPADSIVHCWVAIVTLIEICNAQIKRTTNHISISDFHYRRSYRRNCDAHYALIFNCSSPSLRLEFRSRRAVLIFTRALDRERFISGRWGMRRSMSFTSRLVAVLCIARTPYVPESAVTQIGTRELARRARTRTCVLTLLRCSSVWCADINAHGSLPQLSSVHTRAGTSRVKSTTCAVVVVAVCDTGLTAGERGVRHCGEKSVEIRGRVLIKGRIVAHVARRCANYISKERDFSTFSWTREWMKRESHACFLSASERISRFLLWIGALEYVFDPTWHYTGDGLVKLLARFCRGGIIRVLVA